MNNSLRVDLTSAIRMLAADAVEQANSGHPGAPMGQADLALVLWDEFFTVRSRFAEMARVEIVSCCPVDMLQCCSILYFTCLA